jgi:hypothetical protein
MRHPTIHPAIAVIPHAIATFRLDRLPLSEPFPMKMPEKVPFPRRGNPAFFDLGNPSLYIHRFPLSANFAVGSEEATQPPRRTPEQGVTDTGSEGRRA